MRAVRCGHCGAEIPAKTAPRRRFCSDRCRKAAWTAQQQAQADQQRELVRRLAKAAGLPPEDLA